MPRKRARITQSTATTRSRITNGTALLPTVDARSSWARLMKDTYLAVIQHCGGDDAISDLERLVARRIGTLEAELVFMEDRFAMIHAAGGVPEAVALELYSRVSNTQRRHCESVGWRRRPRDVTPPSLGQYLSARAMVENGVHEAAGESNTANPTPTSVASGNRTGRAPAGDSAPSEHDRSDAG